MTVMVYCYIGILILWTIVSEISSQDCNPHVCRITRIKKMRAADCFKMDLHDFPPCLPSNMEVIDLSYNRIRKLKKNDLENYSSLKILYLSENMISTIEDGFFDHAGALVALDVSVNGMIRLPPKVFHLPSLSKLYLSQNANTNIVEVVEEAKPIESPLSRLDISFNELESLPDLGEMVYLVEYNISGNDLLNLTPRMFSGLCNLEFLYNNNMTVQFSSACDCWAINSWLTKRKVKFEPFQCDMPYQEQCDQNIDTESLAIYEKCLEKHKTIVLQARMLKIVLPCVVIILVIVIAITYYVYRKQQHKKRRNRHNRRDNSSEVLSPLRELKDHRLSSEFNKTNDI